MAHPTKAICTALLFAFLLLALPFTILGQHVTEHKVLTLLKQLDDKDREISNSAAEHLRQFGAEAVSYLIKALKSSDSRIRSNAARTLGEVGPGAKDSVPDLIEALQDSDENVGHAAIDALERMKLEADVAIPIFINLLKSKDYYLSLTASDNLVEIGKEAVPHLIDVLKSDSPNARNLAAGALGKIQPKATEAVPALSEALKDEDGDVRLRSADALGEIGPEARAAIPFLINAMGDENEGVRGAAVDALKKIGTESILPLIEAFGNKDSTVAAISIDALREFGPDAKPAMPHLTRLLLLYENKDIRQRAARALGAIGPEAIPSLLKALQDKNAEVRGCAAVGFYEMGAKGKTAVSELAEALHDSNMRVRHMVAQALGEMGPAAETAVPDLIEALKDTDRDVRSVAAQALEKIGTGAKEAIPTLINALEDKEGNISSQAASALEKIAVGEMGDDAKAGIPKLIRVLRSENKAIRRSAASVLGKMGPEGKVAIEPLIEALDDSEEDVRNKAAESLANISFALSNAWALDSINLLKKAYLALHESPYPKVREQAELVKQSINYLELQWWSRLINFIRSNPLIIFTVGTYVSLILITLGLLWLRPLWLLLINEALSSNADKLPKKIGSIDMPLRYLLVIGFFHYHPRVLDAWISKRVVTARKLFSLKPTVEERETHIATPVILNKESCPELNINALASVFSKELSYLLIWGDGGAGKTSLACLLAKQAMSEKEGDRLCKRHLMLPVLIEQGLELQVGDHEESLLKFIGTQLRLLTSGENKIAPELLRHLVRRRRILLIIDSLSEMNDASRSNILSGIMGLPVNACVFTSRTEEQLNGLPMSTVKMLRIKGNKLATFMEMYLSYRGKRDLFDDEEFFEACRRLSLIVGDRDITALIAKLYAEQMIAEKEGATDSDAPRNIPELMLSYLNDLCRDAGPDDPDIRVVHRVAKCIAWECLKKTLKPMSAQREDILSALGGEEAGEPLLTYLEERLKVIQTVGAGRDRIRFALDPLAEYLAGIHLVDKNGKDEQAWRNFIAQVDEQGGVLEDIKGFLLAIRDCCLPNETDAPVPSFVADELAKRAGLPPENKKKLRLDRRVQMLIRDLKLPDAEDRAEAAKELRDLYKEKQLTYFTGTPVENPKPDSKIVVPVLIKVLKDSDSSVRNNVVGVLAEIGPEAKAAVPSLIEALKDQYRGVRMGAALALGKIGPEAKAAVPALIEALNDPDTCVNAAAVFGHIGPDASAAAPALIKALEDPDEGVRTNAANALISIRPEAKIAVPALIKVLHDQSRSVRMNAANALWMLGSEAKEAVPTLIQILNDEDIEVRKSAARAIASTKLDSEPVISALASLLEDQDKDLRCIAVFALGNLGKAAIPSLKLAARDKNQEVRARAILALEDIGATI